MVRDFGNLAVYANEDGDICLRQADHIGAGDDDVVVIPRQQVPRVIAAIEIELKKSAQAKRSGARYGRS